LNVHAGYELAIDAALGAANSHIVSENEQAARQAIAFLKQNQSGRATFIPLTVLKERYVSNEALVVCDNTKGFLGTADQFVDDTLDHHVVSSSLLQNVIVVDDLEHGNHLASLLKYQYKIVTLDGDVIHKGGTMSGGKIREHASIISAKAEFATIDEKITTLNEQIKHQDYIVSKQRELKASTDEDLLQKRIALAQLEPVVEAKRSKYERLKSELESLSPDTIQHDGNFEDQLIKSLNHVYSKRDEITGSINSKREQKVKLLFELDRKEKQLHQVRKEYNDYLSKERTLELELSKMKTNYSHYIERLNSDYQMTIDYARTLEKVEEIEKAQQEVALLRQEIASMGNINMDAPQEYEEVNQRYEFLLEQLAQLKDAKDQLMSVIDEMDTIMVERFSEMIHKINGVLPEVFSALFGGGKAKLVLDTPDDLLNTGVDIDVFPPGKTIKSIRLFSGGEKSLIAISVLFAILKVRHVPLCLFDEVEASLDQGNVERFANYLKTFADQTQFVVITHYDIV
jgi:chromosome segregation protein